MRRVTVLTLLVVLLGGLLVAPAAAGLPEEVPEVRIHFLCGEPGFPLCITDLDAGEPFFIAQGIKTAHGQGINMAGVAPAWGHNEVKLFVDGLEVEADWVFHSTVLAQKVTGTIALNLFVFPEGLAAGEHVFIVESYVTCSIAEVGVVEGCERPSDTLNPWTRTLTVVFH